VVDLGTGDGRFVLQAATARPDVLAIGVDADAASMADAARRARRGGRANALFVIAAAEALPPELDGIATSLTVHFPWGSLLRGLLQADTRMIGGIARVTRPGAEVRLLLSVTERDHIAGLPCLDQATADHIGRRYAAHGLELRRARPATPDDLAASHSRWARRLAAGVRRPAWLLRLRRSAPVVSTTR
jgi:16S rRNA (adenine(1408)-N(1))-methyltransferase